MVVEPLLPEIERLSGSHAPANGVHHPRAGTALARPGVFEKRDVGPGVAVFVRVEEVVDGGVVLVDGLLYKPQPEQPRVELDVPRRVRGDGGDVMDAFELHAAFNLPRPARIPAPRG